MPKVLEEYKMQKESLVLGVSIVEEEEEFVRRYFLNFPEFGAGTKALMNSLKASILSDSSIKSEKMSDPKFIEELKKSFTVKAVAILEKDVPRMLKETRDTLVSMVLEEMLGLGKMEFLLNDPNLEELVVNSAKEPIWVYHKKWGWLKTNIFLEDEADTQNYANIIARRIGKQITTLSPLLDAHLITGDRANATLFPISGNGNTITIRRFRREPWTVTDFIENKTLSSEIMALVWMAMQFELNIVVSGGTGSGKTSLLNVMMPFIQPNHRIISIEDTRELSLPHYLHWVPLTTREPNPEGRGGISMLELMVNSLRMRPDRIIVGEVRRQREAEVMFEAMHTGHSVYTTVHANTADETIRRLTNPPISVPISMLDAVHLNVVMFRNRRLGTRRILQVAEYVLEKRGEEETARANVLYRWRPQTDDLAKHAEAIRFFDELALHTGMTADDINAELREKKRILDWMVAQNIRRSNEVGYVMAQYYLDSNNVLKLVDKNKKMEFV